MRESEMFIEADDGKPLYVRRWSPDTTPRGIVQIVHGMAEHSARYSHLAETLTDAGFDVWADDHRGHGRTAVPGMLGYPGPRDSFFRIVKDLRLVSQEAMKTVSTVADVSGAVAAVPLVLFGHSWGSFLAQGYVERYGSILAGCALSGTRGPGQPGLLYSGAIIASLLALLRGPASHSPLLRSLADGPYSKPFEPTRTPFDWLSTVESEVDKYAADPLCGFPCSISFYRDLSLGLLSIHSEASLQSIPKDLPILVLAGSQDPVGDMGESPKALVSAYKDRGLGDVEFELYEGARHEILNETVRESVEERLLGWIERVIA